MFIIYKQYLFFLQIQRYRLFYILQQVSVEIMYSMLRECYLIVLDGMRLKQAVAFTAVHILT